MSDDLSKISKPLRKILLTGNTLEPIRTGFVITNLNRYIIYERELSLYRKYKRKKNEGKQVSNAETSLERKFKNMSIVPGIQYPKTAVRLWEESVPALTKLVDDEKATEILNDLLEATKLKNACRKTVVLCLVILIKKSKEEGFISRCFDCIARICPTTELFMLFIEIWKLYSAKVKSSGWGKRMKKMVRKWYSAWDPQELALEVTRYPSAYKWAHKDVIKMAHVDPKRLPLGTQVVLHYVLQGLKKAQTKFKTIKETEDLLSFIQIIDKKGSVDDILKRGKLILEKYEQLCIKDFPSQFLSDIQVVKFILDKGHPDLITEILGTSGDVFKLISTDNDLRSAFVSKFKDVGFQNGLSLLTALRAYNFCRRTSSWTLRDGTLEAGRPKLWMKNMTPSATKITKPRSAIPRPNDSSDFFVAFDAAISQRAKSLKMTDGSCLIFVDMQPSIDYFISTCPEDTVSKEIRASQAIAVLSLIFSNNGIDALPASTIASKIPRSDSGTPYPVSVVHNNLCKMSKQNRETLNIETSLKTALEKKVFVCFFLYYEVSSELLQDIHTKFIEAKKMEETNKLKLVVVELRWTMGSPLVSSLTHPDLLFLFGFNRSFLPCVNAFLEGAI